MKEFQDKMIMIFAGVIFLIVIILILVIGSILYCTKQEARLKKRV